MEKQITIKLLPSEAENDNTIKAYLAASGGVNPSEITGFYRVRKSIDARGKQIFINVAYNVFINEPYVGRRLIKVGFKDVRKAKRKVIVIGAGPAGLFAALSLIENGIQPIILERGKDVRSRRRDLAVLNKEGVVNAESNYCFGEGGAGTYSDGKLYTRSNKRGDINRVLNLFVQFGAEEQILVDAHPHIGTNKLPQIITSIRQTITDYGGVFLFEKKVVDFTLELDKIKRVVTADGDQYFAEAVILATGHSARDIFTLLNKKNILIEAKPFALGVRIEHPQTIIDSIQYHCNPRSEFLPPASYSLVEQVQQKGVFSFCMCPGGIIAPAATGPGELVVNGWSPSKRNNPFANSGMVVSVDQKDITDLKDFRNYLKNDGIDLQSPLNMMYFQKMVEGRAYTEGGGDLRAPAQRMVDFCDNKHSSSLPACSYLPGISSAKLDSVLPNFIQKRLQEGFKAFGKKMKGYFTNEAVVVATESRTSSPVRIPRNSSLHHPQIQNLYPCGEGAGYAGGIVSAAMDGERIAFAIATTIH